MENRFGASVVGWREDEAQSWAVEPWTTAAGDPRSQSTRSQPNTQMGVGQEWPPD